jgi:parallel beta-helix repeat protein
MHSPAVRYILVSVAFAIVALGPTPMAHATSGRMVINANKTLTADHTGQIQLNANNITLDCAGHKISYTVANTTGCGSGGAQRCGIRAENRSGITIKNCEVTGAYDYGVWIAGTTSSVVDHVTARSNVVGFRIEDSDLLTIRHSTAITCTGGYEIRDSSDVTMFADSAVSNEGDGIDVNDSSYVNIQQAQILDNGVNGIELDGGPHATVGSSTIRYNGQHGLSLDPSGTNAVTFPCSAFSISSNVVEFNSEDGIRLQDCDSGFIRNNTAQFNGGCDADQDGFSTGNSWTGNILQNWCPGVPNPH